MLHEKDGAKAGSLAWAATLRSAARYQNERGRVGGPIILRADDLRFWRRRPPSGCLLFFVVDASGSMAAWRRMRQTKAAILALLRQAYQHRDRIALLAFRGQSAELLLPPTAALAIARRGLEALPTGGTTPLAHGLAAARRFILGEKRRSPGVPIWTVVLTDGRTNVSLSTGQAWDDALSQARALAACDSQYLVVDTETGWPRFGQARSIAQALAADCLSLEEVLGRELLFDRRAAGFIPAVDTAGINPAARQEIAS
jgi:magnesium chelatase subunit D